MLDKLPSELVVSPLTLTQKFADTQRESEQQKIEKQFMEMMNSFRKSNETFMLKYGALPICCLDTRSLDRETACRLLETIESVDVDRHSDRNVANIEELETLKKQLQEEMSNLHRIDSEIGLLMKRKETEIFKYLSQDIDAEEIIQTEINEASSKYEQLKIDWKEYSAPFMNQLSKLIDEKGPELAQLENCKKSIKKLEELDLDSSIEAKTHQLQELRSTMMAVSPTLKFKIPSKSELKTKLDDLKVHINQQNDEIHKLSLEIEKAKEEIEKQATSISKYHQTMPKDTPFDAECYSYVAGIRNLSEVMISKINEIGKYINESRMLEEEIHHIEHEERVRDRIEQVKKDIEALRHESGQKV